MGKIVTRLSKLLGLSPSEVKTAAATVQSAAAAAQLLAPAIKTVSPVLGGIAQWSGASAAKVAGKFFATSTYIAERVGVVEIARAASWLSHRGENWLYEREDADQFSRAAWRYLLVIRGHDRTFVYGTDDRDAGARDGVELEGARCPLLALFEKQVGDKRPPTPRYALAALGYEIKREREEMDAKAMFEKLAEVERGIEGRKAGREPRAHRLTKLRKATTPGTFAHYYAGKHKRREIWFCVADHVNAAGYVLAWRLTRIPGNRDGAKNKRDLWHAFRSHTKATAWARRKVEELKKGKG